MVSFIYYLDILLCHDDELDDRRIAFIYYLVPENWTEQDGGALDLFAVNGKINSEYTDLASVS